MSDEDHFSYKPLRVTKRRKKMLGGRRKGKKADLDIKEEVKEGIVEIFAGTKWRRSLIDDKVGWQTDKEKSERKHHSGESRCVEERQRG